MRAVLYGAGDVRVENVPGAAIKEPTDSVVPVASSCVCGSGLCPYCAMPASGHGQLMGHEFVGVVEELGPEASGLRRRDLVIAPFVWSDGTRA